MTTTLPSIPEIAEILSEHTRNSNDAIRHMAEYVLPVMGIDGIGKDDIPGAVRLLAEKDDIESLVTGVQDFLSDTARIGNGGASASEKLEEILTLIEELETDHRILQ